MAAKTKVNGLNTMHTAGIYSDMTVDGPQIGTLVIIVDRAKNLPNRKTIGKQNPYCAARLGKEAKKTETDQRGGQTPRWDQELRFVVHDSPDYYQLKVSVFNDDKRTDLIGETWVNLQEIIIPGGGQNDLWHNLNCKGKYAGEIRIEITYYDSRPKQEKPDRIKQMGISGSENGERDSLKGPRQPKAPVKRRPLPSDPVTGVAPLQVDDSPLQPYQSQTAIPEHMQTPPRRYQSPGYISSHSPLQSVEYHTPSSSHRMSQSQGYEGNPVMNEQANGYTEFSNGSAASPIGRQMPNDRYEIYDTEPHNQTGFPYENDHYEDEDKHNDPQDRYDPGAALYELPQPDEFGTPPSPGGPPPPPPAHRSRNESQHVSPAPYMTSHDSYGFPSDSKPSNVYDAVPYEMHRHSMPTYPQSHSYQPYTPPSRPEQLRRSQNSIGYEESSPRHHSYDSNSNSNYRSMQPTVEDAPPTPGSGSYSGHRESGSRAAQFDDRRYEQVPSPAPLNLSGRGSAASGRYSASTASSTQFPNGYASTNSPVSFRDQTVTAQTSYNTLPQQSRQQRRSMDDRAGANSYPDNYGPPAVPATLVPGMDPDIAQEISDRIYAEKRASYNQSTGNPPRSRYDSSQHQSGFPHPLSYQETAQPFASAPAAYSERQGRFATAVSVPIVKPRAISPDPRSPTRKSVSPAPPESPEKRRLSGVPFGPDSYNALNPSLASSTSTPSLSARYDTKAVDPNAKIIRHDGTEIDPSDHIPESNYAPLLEPKKPKEAAQQPDRNYRSRPVAHPNPASGRTPLRQAIPRPHSMAAASPVHMSGGIPDPSTPVNGRNRLQKKMNRVSAQPASHSSPLAPISPYQDNSYVPSPRSLPRPHTGDYSNENYAPQHYGSSPGYRGAPGPPPIPAKIPVGPHAPPPQGSSADAWTLLDEMKNIDLGSGRARRKGR